MERKRILVGMSGGVDSSVSAALLVAQGYDIEGVFLKVWSEDDVPSSVGRRSSVVDRGQTVPVTDRSSLTPEDGRGPTSGVSPERVATFANCPWEEDLADARAVAHQLGIKLHVLNVQREYFARVVEQMTAGYAAGVTPNPDVLCNSEIKFGLLYDWAMERGFDVVATGHYAQIRRTNYDVRITDVARPVTRNSYVVRRTELYTAKDSFKDQTYFLWRVPRERFAQILFPIGHLVKAEVRVEAKRFGLPNAAKPDSQGICFLGHVDVRNWLKRELGTVPGPVLNRDGTIVGRHEGAGLYTIGQRQGLGIFGGGPVYYVVEKDVTTNTLVVAERPAAARDTFTFSQVNWLVDEPQVVIARRHLEARIRHQGERILVSYMVDGGSYIGEAPSEQDDLPSTTYDLRLASPAFGVAAGQSVVLYQGETVVGGGIIQ